MSCACNATALILRTARIRRRSSSTPIIPPDPPATSAWAATCRRSSRNSPPPMCAATRSNSSPRSKPSGIRCPTPARPATPARPRSGPTSRSELGASFRLGASRTSPLRNYARPNLAVQPVYSEVFTINRKKLADAFPFRDANQGRVGQIHRAVGVLAHQLADSWNVIQAKREDFHDTSLEHLPDIFLRLREVFEEVHGLRQHRPHRSKRFSPKRPEGR